MDADFIKEFVWSIIYSLLWIVIMTTVFTCIAKWFKFSMYKELIEDENIALAIMFSGFFIAIWIIIAAAII